jgi:hypothetical protein
MLNLIGHLLPDPVLNTRWPEGHLEKLEEISRRLDHLCEMFSRDGFTLDWNAGAGKKITSEFATIEFSINHIWEFIWQFQPRHFYLASTRRPGESWVRSLVCIPGNYYEEGFCAASGVLIDKSADGPFKPNTLFSSDLRSPDVARGAVQDLIKSGNPILRPMTMMLFHRSIPLDYFNLFCIAETIFKNPAFTHDKQFYPIQPWVEKPQYIKNDLLCQAMEHQVIDMACLMIDHGADVNLKTPRGLYLIQMAVGAGPVWSRYLDLEYRVLSRLIAHHVDLEVKDGVDPLFIAVNGPVKGVELLLKAGANPLARDSHGNTPRSCYNPKEYMADPRTPEILWLAEEAARRAATPAAGAGAGAGAGAVQPHATP